jgi:glutathione S-transferase
MLTVHHLNNSRSQRIIWLLEELGVDYQIKTYQRDPVTNLAPSELEAVHPLGKSPVLTDEGITVIESGAIIDYLLRHYGGGQFLPATNSNDHEQYLQWLHYGESGAVLPLMLKLYTSKLPDGGEALKPRINDELTRHLGYIEKSLEGVNWFVGNTFSGADVQLSFIAEIAPMMYTVDKLPNLMAFRNRCHERPAYQRGIAKTAFYAYGPKD